MKQIANTTFKFRLFWLKEPPHAENVSAKELYLYRSTRRIQSVKVSGCACVVQPLALLAFG